MSSNSLTLNTPKRVINNLTLSSFFFFFFNTTLYQQLHVTTTISSLLLSLIIYVDFGKPLSLLNTVISLLGDDVAFVKQSANCLSLKHQFIEVISFVFFQASL